MTTQRERVIRDQDIARETVGEYQWGFHDDEQPLFMAENGLS